MAEETGHACRGHRQWHRQHRDRGLAQRDGHRVSFVDPLGPAEATSFGNAGSLSPSACLPVGSAGDVEEGAAMAAGLRWRPLAVRWWYAPVVPPPWLWRHFLKHSSRTRSGAYRDRAARAAGADLRLLHGRAAAARRGDGAHDPQRLPLCLFRAGGAAMGLGDGAAPSARSASICAISPRMSWSRWSPT